MKNQKIQKEYNHQPQELHGSMSLNRKVYNMLNRLCMSKEKLNKVMNNKNAR